MKIIHRCNSGGICEHRDRVNDTCSYNGLCTNKFPEEEGTLEQRTLWFLIELRRHFEPEISTSAFASDVLDELITRWGSMILGREQ